MIDDIILISSLMKYTVNPLSADFMDQMAESQLGDSLTLAELFQKGWEAQMKADSGELSSNSKEFQVQV